MIILGLDPGYEQSALVALDGKRLLEHCIEANADMLITLTLLSHHPDTELVIERVASFGMPVGEEIFETVYWTGRFAERWNRPVYRIKRHEVKAHLCKHPRANDTHIRQALIDHFGPSREAAIGSKRMPGPLYGVHADEWSALAVAVTYQQQRLIGNEVERS